MGSYLVTGGAGFIGSSLVEALLTRGHAVRVLDNFSTGKQENLSAFLDRIELLEGDITSPEDVQRAVAGVEVVLHHAALPSVPLSVKEPLTANAINVRGTLHLLEAARQAGVRRFVFASSSAIYGDQRPDLPKVETMYPQPISPYGADKLAAEQYCQVFYRVYGLETVALRYFNVYGPRQDPHSMYSAVIPLFISALLRGEAPTIFGDGEQTRDFTFVGDVVTANLLAASRPAGAVAGRVFNIATGQQIALNDLIDVLNRITGAGITPVYTDPRPGDIKFSLASIEQAVEHLAYRPASTLEQGLRATVDWYRQQMPPG
ncbi:MAG: SDR family oxidoreductase [Anaerolineae bacterium]